MNFCQKILEILKHPNTKFGIKLALAGGAAYYIAETGVWRDHDTTLALCNKIKTDLKPYTSEIQKRIPIEIPSLPSKNQTSYLAIHYWNKGVKATFAFLADLPATVSQYSKNGYKAIVESEQMKNVFNQENKPDKS